MKEEEISSRGKEKAAESGILENVSVLRVSSGRGAHRETERGLHSFHSLIHLVNRYLLGTSHGPVVGSKGMMREMLCPPELMMR